MESDEIQISVYDKREGITSSFLVKKLSDNSYKMTENDIFNCTLTYGTEFETRTKKDGVHEVVRILKESEFITRRFMLRIEIPNSDYRVLGDEIMKIGGFWQVDFGGIATVNIPKNVDFDIDEIFKIFNLNPTEIKD